MVKEDKKLSDFQLFSSWCPILLVSINLPLYLSNTCRDIWVLLREKQPRIQLLIMFSIYHYLKLNHILQNSSGSNAKWRAGSLQTSSIMMSMLFPATSVYCVNQQAKRLLFNINAPSCRWVPSHQLKEHFFSISLSDDVISF